MLYVKVKMTTKKVENMFCFFYYQFLFFLFSIYYFLTNTFKHPGAGEMLNFSKHSSFACGLTASITDTEKLLQNFIKQSLHTEK